MTSFKALRVSEDEDRAYKVTIEQRNVDELPPGDLLIRVNYSALNYKDALSAAGNKGVTRKFPHTPGIDAVGVVEASESPRFVKGDIVIVTGYDLGMNTSGGLAEYIRVPCGWAVKKPKSLTSLECMVYGTAGVTAALCINKLIKLGAEPDKEKPILVTGASGGVGCMSIALLHLLGFKVSASTGKASQSLFLEEIGASSVINRSELSESNRKPLLKPLWSYAIDSVGGDTLVNVLKSLTHGGSVACCGLAQSAEMDLTVFPFILRGVNLLGVDSVECELAEKEQVWSLLAGDWKLNDFTVLSKTISLEEVPNILPDFLEGKVLGRIVVAL